MTDKKFKDLILIVNEKLTIILYTFNCTRYFKIN